MSITATLFDSIESIVAAAAEGVRPGERLTVPQAAVKYRKLNNPGSYVGPWKNEMTQYLVEPMELLTSVSHTGMIFAGPAQCGKLLDLDTPIPTPSGWTRFGDLEVGDSVFGLDGMPTKVIVLNPIKRDTDAFEITFDDGEVVYADATHDWCVNDMWSKNPYRMEKRTTAWLFQRYEVPTKTGRRFRFSIPVAAPLQTPEKKLPLDPYLLGVWLGDGGRHSGDLTLGHKDAQEIMARIAGARDAGDGNAAGTARRIVVPGLRKTLRSLGLTEDVEKHIPPQYLRASETQRRALLKGLMDTDGSQDRRGRAEFTSSVVGLSEQVYELMVSLGLKVHRDDREPTYQNGVGRRSYRLTFTPQNPGEVFSLVRHVSRREAFAAARTVRPTHSGRRFIRAMRRVESRPMRCIGVDAPDHLYLCGRGMIATHNTDMFLNWQTYSVICDPADMMLIEKAQVTARDFSIRRVDRLHRHSMEVGSRLILHRNSDNTFDKRYRSGMILNLSWPSINELSGRPVPRLWLSDYDRMEQDVDGEGEPFDLARKRATTFRSHGMCVAESSPGFVIDNPKWIAKSRHEAPPTAGILKLYNRGDRRRWYWRCVVCRNAFEPDFSLLSWPDSEDIVESAEMATMKCPHCDIDYSHDPAGNMPGKHEFNRNGRWIMDGMIWTPEGHVTGKPFRSDIGSFWLKGPAAAFVTWKELVLKFLQAEKEFADTGTETSLKTTVNTDQGLPYIPKAQAEARLPETLKARSRDFGQQMVPHGVRFLIATIDVQKNRFEVQVHGVGVGGDMWVIDRYKIIKSKRLDEDEERYWINPGAYFEDWKLIVEEVMLKTYPLIDGSDRHMSIKLTLCDSGGKEGVTANAYKFVRWLRDGRNAPDASGDAGPMETGDYTWEPGLFPRFQLVKGDTAPTAPRIRLTYPDSQRKDRHAGARGEIPVLFLNSNALKDSLDKMLDRTEARGGRINFPAWLPDTFYTELTVEVRDPVKGWINPKSYRNESWDLLYYAIAGTLTRQVSIDTIDWERPPSWAKDWDENDLVFSPSKRERPITRATRKPKADLGDLAEDLA